MKVEPAKIDKQELRRLLRDQYELSVTSLDFVPQGEESYGYILETSAQAHYFVKLYPHPSELNVRYKAANRLHTACGLEFVVHPHATRYGKFHVDFGEYALAIFDFIEGTVSDQTGFSDNEWKQTAILTAALHKSLTCPKLPSLPVEQFEIWFEDWLLKVLHITEETKPLNNECESEAKKLLMLEKNDILMTLDKLKQLADRIPTIPFQPVLTHGDLKAENFIKDSSGNLHLIDWSKIAIAPPERDLVNFVGERFDLFLTEYVNSYDEILRLHPELFEFYRYFLTLWSIADYGSWILLEDADLMEKEHAWTELQQYFPMNRERVRIDEIRQVVRSVTNGAQQQYE